MPANPSVDLIQDTDATAYLSAAGAPYGGDITQIVTAVSAQIQSYLSRKLVSATYTATLNGRGEQQKMLPNTPISAVSSVTIGMTSVPAATDPHSHGYLFDDRIVYLRGYQFVRGVQNVRIAYTAGYDPASIPFDIQQATREGVLAVVIALGNDPRAVKMQAGDTEIDYGLLADVVKVCLTPNVTSILREFGRRVVPI